MPTKARKKPRLPTPESLGRAALWYLERFAASEAGLRRMLLNKIRRYGREHPEFSENTEAMGALNAAIDAIVETHKRSGAINDRAFAEMKVHSLRRRGVSAAKITEKLRQKGVEAPHIGTALAAHAQDCADEDSLLPPPRQADRQAALTLARKKGLGPFRRPDKRATDALAIRTQHRKDAAALARAGFGMDLIRGVLDWSGENEDGDG